MTGRPDHIEVPVPSIGPGGSLRAARSRYGDYFDFELLGAAQEPGDYSLVSAISGYACRTRLLLESGVNEDGGIAFDYALLVVGNTTVFLPAEQGEALAEFLSIELERG